MLNYFQLSTFGTVLVLIVNYKHAQKKQAAKIVYNGIKD
jgi:hypothetical protein